MSKKIVFFGNEKLATGIPEVEPVILRAVEAAGFEIEQVVTGPLKELKSHESKLAVLAAYGKIIPQAILDQFPLGIINVHPSLLPVYRGPTPIEQAILDGSAQTGVSIMRLSAKMDEGPLYKQKLVNLTVGESKAELATQLQKLGSDLIVEVLPGIAKGTLKPHQQPHPDRATYSHILTKLDGAVDWNLPAERIEREIRAYMGWPGSRTEIGKKEVTILEAKIVDATGVPGEVINLKKQLVICCGDKALEILRLKPAGKKEMTGQAFMAGYKHLVS
ncbi:MAG TPA: methionyl-tRNA formyltransferase [Patescibacteria group bacterium]|nr:methionyl-tRNA formyltransferase [Patescibacteria group bacterium]